VSRLKPAGIETRSLSLTEAKNEVEQLVNVNQMNMQNRIEQSVRVEESEIGAVAYRLWEQAGRPAGRDLQFWLDAESQLRPVAKAASSTPGAPMSPVASDKSATHKTAGVRRVPSRANSPKAQQKFRRN
jgi:Protein of unknown function (DUF2934)